MKRKAAIAILACYFSTCVAPFVGAEDSIHNQKELDTEIIKEEKYKFSSLNEQALNVASKEKHTIELTSHPYIVNELTIKEQKENEYNEKLAQLDKSDKMQWFIQYKALNEEYSQWIEQKQSIYDNFSKEELQFLFMIVEAEVTGENHFDEKANVASVIFNRLEHEDFPNMVIDILTEKSQFSSYSDGRFRKVKITETTELACEYAWMFGDTTGGALYFDSTNGNSWASKNLRFLFKDSVGHSFYSYK